MFNRRRQPVAHNAVHRSKEFHTDFATRGFDRSFWPLYHWCNSVHDVAVHEHNEVESAKQSLEPEDDLWRAKTLTMWRCSFAA
jgi:hypothetical protein